MSNRTNEQMSRLSKKAEKEIHEAYLEMAVQIKWLALGTPPGARPHPLDHTYWQKVAEELKAIEHARHRYMEGEYQLAIDALPEF